MGGYAILDQLHDNYDNSLWVRETLVYIQKGGLINDNDIAWETIL